MDTIWKAIHSLENKLSTLFSAYEFLKEENDLLLKRQHQLQQQLHELQQEKTTLEEKYALLKIAKTIDGSNESTRETKLKINALIREIDKCVVQLND